MSRKALRALGVRVATVENTTGGRVVTEATKLRVVSQKARSAERERAFLANLRALGVQVPVPEFRFHPVRRWRLDYAWPALRVGLEVEGGVWTRGKHGRGSGIVKDMVKSNALAALGWRLMRVTPAELALPETATFVKQVLSVP